MSRRKLLPIFLLAGLLTVLIAFIPDLVSDELKTWFLERFGPNYPWYLIGFFVIGCFVLLALSGDFRDLFSFDRQANIKKQTRIAWSEGARQSLKSAKETIKEARLEETIKTLYHIKNEAVDEQLNMLKIRLAKYKHDSHLGIIDSEVTFNRISKNLLDLIKTIETQLAEGQEEYQQLRDAFRRRYFNRLEQKLASRQPVNLRRIATTEGTSEQVAATFIPYTSEEIIAEIGKTFQDAYGRLLIVGQPGAGKTTLLLQLADRLFDLEKDTLPVVVNLATWQSSYGKLETWLEAILAAEFSTNKAGAKAVLRQSNLILLLDGLDELKTDEAINSCLAAIADYGSVAGRQFVVTCRIEEYKRVEEDARVNLQIEVGPLQGDQIEEELNRMGREQPEAVPLLQAIKKDPLLKEAIETPFYFNTLQLLFAGKLPVFTTEDLEGRKVEITEKFISGVLLHIVNKPYPSESATHWLSFLASQMNERNLVVFELRDLQYDWWKEWTRWNIVIANFIKGLVVGLVAWLVVELVVWLVVGPVVWLVVAPVAWLAVGLVNSTVPRIVTHDFVHWSMKGLISHIKRKFIVGLFFGLGFGLLFGLFVGLVVWLVVWLVEFIGNGSSDLLQIKTPYQRFNSSMKVLYFSILQHFHLRRLLYSKGALPLDLVAFLNEMTAHYLLESDGATWRFRHRIIQDYFAERWEEDGKVPE